MMPPLLLELPPNRTRRNYRGGALLDEWEGRPAAADGNCPEDWIASTTAARNPGLAEMLNEGLSLVDLGDGICRVLRDVFAAWPEHFLGRAHFERHGPNLGFLAKLLDAGMRLHVQAHPTREFARQHLASAWGKLETYVILGCRPGLAPYIRLGFQRPPAPAEWRRIVLEQDRPAMDACFDPIPVAPGEVWVVPGGLPHAIGEGLLVMEVMEPTDLVVRCEFEREGIMVPPAARFMGRPPELALQIFDFTTMPPARVREMCMVKPQNIRTGGGLWVEQLIGPGQTDCFREWRIKIDAPATLPLDGVAQIGVVTQGRAALRSGADAIAARRGTKFLTAGTARELTVTPAPAVEILMCAPGI